MPDQDPSGSTPMIDLSTLQIPGPDVVPEPTAEDLSIIYKSLADYKKRDIWTKREYRVFAGLARRCRELEAECNALATQLYDASPAIPIAEKEADEIIGYILRKSKDAN